MMMEGVWQQSRPHCLNVLVCGYSLFGLFVFVRRISCSSVVSLFRAVCRGLVFLLAAEYEVVCVFIAMGMVALASGDSGGGFPH